jgi:hypothetical protein
MGVVLPLLILGAGLYLVFWVLVPLGRGALYEPSSPDKTELMAELAGITPGTPTADLGSGDGRVVIAMARRGAEAHGYEVNPFLVLRARRNIRRAGLQDRAFIHLQSFWSADLSPYRVITVFQVGYIMGRLERKALHELGRGSRVISHHWEFPTLRPETERYDVFVYRIGVAGPTDRGLRDAKARRGSAAQPPAGGRAGPSTGRRT